MSETAFLGETEGPFLGADLLSAAPGVAGGVKEGPRRVRRGCLDAAEHPAILQQAGRGFMPPLPVRRSGRRRNAPRPRRVECFLCAAIGRRCRCRALRRRISPRRSATRQRRHLVRDRRHGRGDARAEAAGKLKRGTRLPRRPGHRLQHARCGLVCQSLKYYLLGS